MGGKQNKDNVKKEYLKVIETQKKAYAKQNRFMLQPAEKVSVT